ncbi:MAG: hypothetical protein M3Y58_06570 [Chloroflexota bacterium]|nr:hypothetical protein [Chloroflexota bacterium]
MDEQEMDVFEHDTDSDLDAAGAMPSRARARRAQMDDARRRASARMDEAQRQAMAVPRKVVSGAVGALPVQTREHLRQGARESVLAVQSFVDAVSSAGLMAVDRLFADPRSPQETAQPRRIVIEREEPPAVV